MDDLDSLLNDLGSLGGAPGAAAGKSDLDDLDDLLNNMGGGPPAASKPTASTPAVVPPAADADLDALMESLGSVTPANATSTTSTTGLGQDDLSELDALMASTIGPVDNSGVTQDELNELNALMGTGGSAADGLDDLDALMQSLDVQAKPTAAPAKAPAKAAPAPTKVVPGAAKTTPVADASKVGPTASPAKTPAAAAAVTPAAATPAAGMGMNPMMGGMGMNPMMGGMGMNPMMGGMGMNPMMGGMGGMNPMMGGMNPMMGGMGMNPMMGGMNPMMGGMGMNPMMGGMNPMMGGMGMNPMMGGMGSSATTGAANAGRGAANAPGGVMGGNRAGGDISNLLSNLNEQMGSLDSGGVASRGICATCNKPIHGEVIQGMGKTFHPEHFICGGCKTPLGTRNFFENNGLPFCENCFQLSFCPRCAYCNEPVLDRCVAALGQKWHVEHFVCTNCTKPFPGGNFFEKENRPFCEECFVGSFAPKCAVCSQTIKGDCVNALGKQWHPQCFTCAYCKQPFSGSFFEKNGKPYCDKHYLLADAQPSAATSSAAAGPAGMCAGCLKQITGPFVEGLGSKWHPEHFLCGFCMSPLKAGQFKESNGKAFCPGCSAKFGIL